MLNLSSQIAAALEQLHDHLSNTQTDNPGALISLQQAFDRLCLGLQKGTYDEASGLKAIEEIQQTLDSIQSAAVALRPMAMQSKREEILARNTMDLADRILSQPRGVWDSRHVEIVQGAIAQLARTHSDEAHSRASALQNRMSNDVWLGNLELSENQINFSEEVKNLHNELTEWLKQQDLKSSQHEKDVDEAEKLLALQTQAMLKRNAQDVSRKNVVASPSQKSSGDVQPQQLPNTPSVDSKTAARAAQNLRNAAQNLISSEYEHLMTLIRSLLKSAAQSMESEDFKSFSAQIQHCIPENDENSSENIFRLSKQLKEQIRSAAGKLPQASNALNSIEKIQWRSQMIEEISSNADNMLEVTDQADARFLEARLLFEQKRMQFEQKSGNASETELLKALDPQVPSLSDSTYQSIRQDIQRLQQIAQSSATADIGLYAPTAGSETSSNITRALQTTDQATPLATPIPALYSELARKSNQLLKKTPQMAFHPSVRTDMGFQGNKYEMLPQSQPLFKRIRFQNDNDEAKKLLPALYKVSGIHYNKENKKGTPLRKSSGDLNLTAENLDLIKLLENSFNPNADKSGNTLSNVIAGTAAFEKNAQDQVAAQLSGQFEQHIADTTPTSDTSELIKTEQGTKELESSIQSEGQQLPQYVQQLLFPYLGFDLTNVKVYAGPVAAASAEALGAHAFTLGQNIFIGANKLDYDSPEGLGLLAHEILHTSHFNSSDSVDSKELAAETVEKAVRESLGDQRTLALESGKAKSATPMFENPSTMMNAPMPNLDDKPAFDADDIYDAVCDRVLELIEESFEMEKARNS